MTALSFSELHRTMCALIEQHALQVLELKVLAALSGDYGEVRLDYYDGPLPEVIEDAVTAMLAVTFGDQVSIDVEVERSFSPTAIAATAVRHLARLDSAGVADVAASAAAADDGGGAGAPAFMGAAELHSRVLETLTAADFEPVSPELAEQVALVLGGRRRPAAWEICHATLQMRGVLRQLVTDPRC